VTPATPSGPQPALATAHALEMAHVLFMDIVAYSTLPMDEQQGILDELQQAVRGVAAVARAQAEDKLICLPTGDGMALVFFGDPEFPVECALDLGRALRQHPEIKLRMGIHTGPVYRVADINAARNVAGGGINMAQRVMDCGDAGHILVSKVVADVLAQVSTWSQVVLQDLGEAEVKHGVRVHIYNLYTDDTGNAELPRKVQAAQRAAEAGSSRARRKKLALGIVGAVVVLAIAAAVPYYRWRLATRYHVAAVKGRPSIAVLGFKNLSAKPEAAWLSTAFSEMLTTELAAGGQLRAIPGENVARMKIDLSLPDTDSLAQDTLAKIYRNLGSDMVVLGSYLDLGGQVRLDLRLEDAIKGDMVAAVSQTGTESQLMDLVSRAGADLREKCGVGKITSQQANEIKALTPSDPGAARLYAEGLTKLRAFEDVPARDFLEKSVAAEPNFALSHAALSRAWGGLGYDAKARDEAKKAFDLSDNLGRDDRLWVEGRYREATHEWAKAVEIYGSLFQSYPDNLDYGLALADAQTSSGKGHDALATIEMLRKLPPPVGDDPRISVRESSAAFALGDFKRAQAVAAQAADSAKAHGAGLVAATALSAECDALERLGEMKKAIASCSESQRGYAAAGDRDGVAGAIYSIAIVLYDRGDYAAAKEKYAEARSVYHQIGSLGEMAGASANIGNIQILTGDLRGGVKALQQPVALYREIGDKASECLVLNSISYALESLGDLPGAQASGEQALAIAREIGDKDTQAEALSFLSDVAYDRGNLSLVKSLLDQAEPIMRDTGNKRRLSGALAGEGQLLLAQDDLKGAREKYQEGLNINNEIGDKVDIASFQVTLANITIEQGDPASAETLLHPAISEFRAEEAVDEEIGAHAVLAQALLLTGKTVNAKKEAESTKALLSKTQNPTSQWEMSLVDGRIQSALGNSAAAKKTLLAVLSEADKLGFVPYSFEARLALGEVEMKSPDADAGRARLQALEKDARAKGFLLIARKATAALNREPATRAAA
jgi:tetratricopeptide (TPR) repeat protein/class 3 adenylate cyclase